MESERGARSAMTIPLALAVARRALVVAVVAVLVAIASLVAALLSGSDSDPPTDAAAGQAQADLAAAQAAVAEAVAMAEAAAARAEDAVSAALAAVASAESAAVAAGEAATLAQEAAGVAFEASVKADMAAAGVAEAEEPLADASDDTGASAATDEAAADETAAEDAGEAAAAVDDESEPAPADGAEDAPEPAPSEPAVALPGEPFEFGPPEGAALAVVGVSHDSVLNVRNVPAGEIVARLDNVMNVGSEPVVYVREPDSDQLIATLDLNRGVIATGNTRQLPTTIWHEIRMGDAMGWASSAFLSPLGATSDATAEIVAILGGAPEAPTLFELGRIVAEAVASGDPPSRIVVSGAPTIGDLGEITVDVLGLPDDAVRGFRLHVLAQRDSDSDPFTLETVESTAICDSHRGVSEEGFCN